jgi:hypothetical protein
MIDSKTEKRFWANVNKESGRWYNGSQCWGWTGKLSLVVKDSWISSS